MNRVLTKEETEAVLEILAKELAVQKSDLLPEATLVGDLGADSLEQVEIAMALEEKFGTCLADEQMEAVKTVQDLFDCLEAALASERALSPSQQK